ncbi:MAG: hypothetical protein V7717_05425 [Porticoccaceae bacterium]
MGFLDKLIAEDATKQKRFNRPCIEYKHFMSGSSHVISSWKITFDGYILYQDRDYNRVDNYATVNFYMPYKEGSGKVVAKMKSGMLLYGLLDLCEAINKLPAQPKALEDIDRTLTYGYLGEIKKHYSWSNGERENSLFAALGVLLEDVLFDAICKEDSSIFGEFDRVDTLN